MNQGLTMEVSADNNMECNEMNLSKAQIRKKKLRRIFVIILAILIPLFLLGSVSLYIEDKEFLDNHQKISAKVLSTSIDTYEGRKGRETNVYRVKYESIIGNKVAVGKLPISSVQYSSLKSGDSLEIVFNKNNPKQHDFLSNLEARASIQGLLGNLFSSLSGVLLFFGIIYFFLTKLFCREPKK